jgi:DNA-binding CsgD family transcriptional regulator
MDDELAGAMVDDSVPQPRMVEWLRELAPSYGFRDPQLLPASPHGAAGVTIVAWLAAEESDGESAGLRLERLVGDARRRIASAPCPFTAAELEVLRWVRVGRTNREIGLILCKSEYTVKTHIQHMLEKSGLDNRLQLATQAW